MKEIGIKLADGSFYPIMEDGSPCNKDLILTTVKDNQTRVLVDLYRSKTGTMEDAEYIDSLQIENLVEHPNGSVELSLNIGLDENNKLSASMNDPETGASSNANVTLVSRTMEERLEPTNYEVVGNNQDEIVEDDNTIELPDENSNNDIVSESDGDFDLPDEINESEVSFDNPSITTTDDKNNSDNLESTEKIDESESISSGAVADIAAGGLLAKAMSNQNAEKDTDEKNTVEIEPVVKDEIPEIDITPKSDEDNDSSESDNSEVDFSLPTDVNLGAEKAAADLEFDSKNDDSTEFNNDLDLPDFMDDNEPSKDSLSDFNTESNEDSDKTVSNESFEEPVFADKSDDTEDMFSADDLELPDFPNEDENGLKNTDNLNDDDFLNEINIPESSDAGKYVKDATPSNGIIFDGLYDKETAAGNSSPDNEGSVEKKTKTPVVICVVCAIICVIATLLILFVVPSKYNLLNKNSKISDAVVEVEPSAEPLPEIPVEKIETIESKEDEVVVVTEPEVVENVVPVPPKELDVKPENITYKIKWGDTLWDISDAYYKNPWKYHMVAKYNGIKNPDYIISGTTIVLPEK